MLSRYNFAIDDAVTAWLVDMVHDGETQYAGIAKQRAEMLVRDLDRVSRLLAGAPRASDASLLLHMTDNEVAKVVGQIKREVDQGLIALDTGFSALALQKFRRARDTWSVATKRKLDIRP
jgi:hypothetical protein